MQQGRLSLAILPSRSYRPLQRLGPMFMAWALQNEELLLGHTHMFALLHTAAITIIVATKTKLNSDQ